MGTKKQIQGFLGSSPALLQGIVALNSDDAWPDHFCSSYKNEFRRIPIQQKSSSKLDFGVIKGPALLIVNDSFYLGWSAYDHLSQTDLEIKHANLAVRAVYLPEARDYHVKMSCRPWWLTWVYLMLVLGFIIAAYLILILPNRQFNRNPI